MARPVSKNNQLHRYGIGVAGGPIPFGIIDIPGLRCLISTRKINLTLHVRALTTDKRFCDILIKDKRFCDISILGINYNNVTTVSIKSY